jgi:coenzyme PQQ precursor peptide PqqA
MRIPPVAVRGGDGRQRRERFPIATPRSRGSPTFHCGVAAELHDFLPPARIRSRNTGMKWKTPVIIEIAVGLEINAYACAEIK